MLANQPKNILHSLWQHKELVVIYFFEEYLCDVFLGAEVVSGAQFQSWTDYLTLAPYCGLLLLGLFISHISRNKKSNIDYSIKQSRVMLCVSLTVYNQSHPLQYSHCMQNHAEEGQHQSDRSL